MTAGFDITLVNNKTGKLVDYDDAGLNEIISLNSGLLDVKWRPLFHGAVCTRGRGELKKYCVILFVHGRFVRFMVKDKRMYDLFYDVEDDDFRVIELNYVGNIWMPKYSKLRRMVERCLVRD